MAKSKAPKTVISFETQEYWDAVQNIVKAASVYAAAEKLRANLEDEATAWKVRGVLTRYYAGDMNKLRDSIHFKRREAANAIRKFNTIAANNGKHQVTKPDSLINFLLDETRRRKYENFSEKHRKKNEIVDLQQIEMEYRDWKVAYDKKKKRKK